MLLETLPTARWRPSPSTPSCTASSLSSNMSSQNPKSGTFGLTDFISPAREFISFVSLTSNTSTYASCLRASLLTSVMQIPVSTFPALFDILWLHSKSLCYAYNFTAGPNFFWHSAVNPGIRRALVTISSLDQLTRSLCQQTVTWDRTILSRLTFLGRQRRSLLVNREIVSCKKPHMFHASSVTDIWVYSSVSVVWY